MSIIYCVSWYIKKIMQFYLTFQMLYLYGFCKTPIPFYRFVSTKCNKRIPFYYGLYDQVFILSRFSKAQNLNPGPHFGCHFYYTPD